MIRVWSLDGESGVWIESLESEVRLRSLKYEFRVCCLESDSESGVWSLIQSPQMQIVVNSKNHKTRTNNIHYWKTVTIAFFFT